MRVLLPSCLILSFAFLVLVPRWFSEGNEEVQSPIREDGVVLDEESSAVEHQVTAVPQILGENFKSVEHTKQVKEEQPAVRPVIGRGVVYALAWKYQGVPSEEIVLTTDEKADLEDLYARLVPEFDEARKW